MNKMFATILMVAIIIVSGCDTNNTTTVCNGVVTKDLPERDKDTSTIVLKEKIFRLANLPDIGNGFNETQIRIWFSYSANIENLLIFEKVGGIWTGSYNTLEYHYPEDTDTLQSINRTSKKIEPKSGWPVFTDSLFKLGLRDLPDMGNIPGYELARDGHWFTVEYADCKMYRIYRYQSPWGWENEFPQAKQVVQISQLLEREFGFTGIGKQPF